MKTYNYLPRFKILIGLTLILTVAILSGSCKKSNNQVSASAYVMIANSAQTSAPQDFYIDNNKLNTLAIAYTQNTNYISLGSGSHVAQFKTSATAAVNISFNESFDPGSYYTVVYTDANTTVTYQDDRTAPQQGSARIRLINVSSALKSNIDFDLNDGTKIVSGLAYKVPSIYSDVVAGTTFTINASGSSTILLSIPATLQAGHIYTIFISGSTSATITYNLVVES